MNDVFNTVETQLIAFFSGITDITDIASNIHAKLMEDPLSYRDDKTPAVAVHTIGYIGDADDRHNDGIRVLIEITDTGATLANTDSNVKKLMWHIINHSRNESPLLEGKGASAQFDDIYVEGGEVYPFKKKGGWLTSGAVNLEVYLKH